MNDQAVHEINWTNEKVARFWGYYSTLEAIENNYFSKQVGDAVIQFVKKYIPLQGKILDYGCGPGFLIEKLLKERLTSVGLDSVESNIRIIEAKFKNDPNFKGAYYADKLPAPIPGEQFDVVFLIETIEHLLPEERQPIIREIYRLLKKNGKLIVTTPNNENLDARKIICPECGCVFHQMQHVSSWTTHSLSRLMADAEFKKIACTTTTFRPRTFRGFLFRVADFVLRRPHVNLIYIGEK